MRKLFATSIVTALIGTGFVLSTAPAQAQSISPGRAVVRLDAAHLTLKQQSKHTYRVVLKNGTSGQWMGDRTVKSGKKKTLVRDLTAKKLVNSWSDLKYSDKGVGGTLMWESGTGQTSAAVAFKKPKLTDKGVSWKMTSIAELPTHLSGAKLSLRRAPSSSEGLRSTLYTYTIADALTVSFDVISASEVKARIYNAGNNNTCWGTTDITGIDNVAVSVKSNTCDTIPYENAMTSYGVNVGFPTGCSSPYPHTGSAAFDLNVTPAGQDQYEYVQAVTLSC